MIKWQKSSFSGWQAQCVEVADSAWVKSSLSFAYQNCIEAAASGQKAQACNGGECAEVVAGHACDDPQHQLPEGETQGVYLRNSRFPDGYQLHFTLPEWDAFVQGVKAGEFDHFAASGVK